MIKVSPNQIRLRLRRRGNVDTDVHMGERPVKTKAETAVMGLQAEECQRSPANLKVGERHELNLSHRRQRKPALPAP